MSWLRFTYKDIEVELTPEVIRDIRSQLAPQIKEMPLSEAIRTVEASGASPKNLISFFKKAKEFGK